MLTRTFTRTFWSAVIGWVVTLILSGTLWQSCHRNSDLKAELRHERSVIRQQQVEIRRYEIAFDRYEAVSDSLIRSGNEINRDVGNRLGTLAHEFGL